MGGLVKDPCPAGIRTELKIKTCKNLDAVEPQRSERMFEGYVIDAGWPNGLPRPPRRGDARWAGRVEDATRLTDIPREDRGGMLGPGHKRTQLDWVGCDIYASSRVLR